MPRKSNNWLSVEGMTDEEVEAETQEIEDAVEASCRALDAGCIEIHEESNVERCGKWRCCCCGRVMGRKYRPHSCATGFTKSWRKVAKKLGLTDSFTRYQEFGSYELSVAGSWVGVAFVVEFLDGPSVLTLVSKTRFDIRFPMGTVVVLGEVNCDPSLQISEPISVA